MLNRAFNVAPHIDLGSLTDVRLYVYYTDFTAL